MAYEYLLMTPGPVQIPEEILKTQAEPMIHHRTPAFEKILVKTFAQLKEVFQTSEPVLILTSTGSGAMEASVVNILSPGDEVLVIESGKFGERWSDICQMYGAKVTRLAVKWGEAVQPEAVQNELNKNPRLRAVFCQACETSTAVLHPIKKLADIIKTRSDTVFVVDAITALGVTELPMDKWGLDVVIAGSQKTFMLPTGLAFISFSKKAQGFMTKATMPRYYFDARTELKALASNSTAFSSPVSLIKALSLALDLILSKGLENQIQEFKKLSAGLRAGGEALGLKNFAQSPSPSVTGFLTPDGINSEKLRAHVEEKYNLTIMGGQDQLKGKIIRVGTLGAVNSSDVRATLARLQLALLDFKFTADIKLALQAFDDAYKGL